MEGDTDIAAQPQSDLDRTLSRFIPIWINFSYRDIDIAVRPQSDLDRTLSRLGSREMGGVTVLSGAAK